MSQFCWKRGQNYNTVTVLEFFTFSSRPRSVDISTCSTITEPWGTRVSSLVPYFQKKVSTAIRVVELLVQDSIPIGCVSLACQMYEFWPSVPGVRTSGGRGRSSSKQVWTVLQWWPPDVSSRRGVPTYHVTYPMMYSMLPYPSPLWTDRRMWKHYPPQTTFADGRNDNIEVVDSKK